MGKTHLRILLNQNYSITDDDTHTKYVWKSNSNVSYSNFGRAYDVIIGSYTSFEGCDEKGPDSYIFDTVHRLTWQIVQTLVKWILIWVCAICKRSSGLNVLTRSQQLRILNFWQPAPLTDTSFTS